MASPTLDLYMLQENYTQGYGDVGTPTNGYYVITPSGFHSLRGYLTEQVFTLDAYPKGSTISEYSFNGNDYNRKTWPVDHYNKHVMESGITQGFLPDEIRGESDQVIFNKLLSDVYQGDFSKREWIETMMQDDVLYSGARDSFMVQLVDRLDGVTNVPTEAAYDAYISKIVPFTNQVIGRDLNGAQENEFHTKATRIGVAHYLERMVSSDDGYDTQNFLTNGLSTDVLNVIGQDGDRVAEPGAHGRLANRYTNHILGNLQRGFFMEMSVNDDAYGPDSMKRRFMQDVGNVSEFQLPDELPTSHDESYKDMDQLYSAWLNDVDSGTFKPMFDDPLPNHKPGQSQTSVTRDDSGVIPKSVIKKDEVIDDGPDF